LFAEKLVTGACLGKMRLVPLTPDIEAVLNGG
jgi:hypothetical protein